MSGAPVWLVHQIDDALACAVDPTCDAWDCRRGNPGHNLDDRSVHVVIGPDKAYLCSRCVRMALDAGAIEPCPCVRCGFWPGVHMGHAEAVGAPLTLWFRVCEVCRPQVDRELEAVA